MVINIEMLTYCCFSVVLNQMRQFCFVVIFLSTGFYAKQSAELTICI